MPEDNAEAHQGQGNGVPFGSQSGNNASQSEHSIGHPGHAAWVMTRADNEMQKMESKENKKCRSEDMEANNEG